MPAGETAAVGAAVVEEAFAGRATGGGAVGLLGGVAGWPLFSCEVPLPVSLAPSAPVEDLTGAPTGTPGSLMDFEGASLVDEGLRLSVGATVAAVEFESGAGSCAFPDSFAVSRVFSEDGREE